MKTIYIVGLGPGTLDTIPVHNLTIIENKNLCFSVLEASCRGGAGRRELNIHLLTSIMKHIQPLNRYIKKLRTSCSSH